MSDDEAIYTVEDVRAIKQNVMMAVDAAYDNRPADGYVPKEDVKDTIQGVFDAHNL